MNYISEVRHPLSSLCVKWDLHCWWWLGCPHDAHYRVNVKSNLLKMSSLFLSFLGWERVPAHPRAQTSERCEAEGDSASQACCCSLWDVAVFHSLSFFFPSFLPFSLLPPPLWLFWKWTERQTFSPSSRFLYSFFLIYGVTTTSLLKAFPWPVSRTVAK